MSDRKFPVGSFVGVGEARREATVLRHGRDASGVYTEVKYYDNGETERVHRSMLRGHRHAVGGDCNCHYRAAIAKAEV